MIVRRILSRSIHSTILHNQTEHFNTTLESREDIVDSYIKTFGNFKSERPSSISNIIKHYEVVIKDVEIIEEGKDSTIIEVSKYQYEWDTIGKGDAEFISKKKRKKVTMYHTLEFDIEFTNLK